jgi:arginine N-succinyltransferase
MFLHLVASQIPATIASHLRGRFDDDGSAPFWRCFGGHFAPDWATSTEAERALSEDPARLERFSGRRLAQTAEVLESLGPVNAASLPAFHLLQAEGLRPNGMYDPIDGGPTLVAEIAETVTGRLRVHGRARIAGTGADHRSGSGDGLVSVAGVDRFRVARCGIRVGDGTIEIDGETAAALGIEADALLAAAPLESERPGHEQGDEQGDGEGCR